MDDPSYQPADRLLVKNNDEIIGHIRQTWRTMRLGATGWPLCRHDYFAVPPEYRIRGIPEALFDAAERRVARRGLAVAECDAADAMFRSEKGWVRCGRYVFSQASPRDVLAQLAVRADQKKEAALLREARRGPLPELSVRHWRHLELPGMMRIYRVCTASAYGALERSEDYWRWLVSRHAFDQIFVALEGPDRLALEEDECRVVGYAVTRDRQILELMTEPGHPTAATELLRRSCSDAIERDWHTLRLHAPPDDPLHQVFAEAGGDFRPSSNETAGATLVQVTNPERFLRRFAVELRARAAAGEPKLPFELGLQIDGAKWQFNLTQTDVELTADRLGRSYVKCNDSTWTRLLLGYADAGAALASGALVASTSLAGEMAKRLFPRVPMWRPPWDDFPL
jgi:predicted N-acetyltransferase YhbS